MYNNFIYNAPFFSFIAHHHKLLKILFINIMIRMIHENDI